MPRVRLRALRDEGRGHPPCRPCPRPLGALRRVRVCIRIPRGPQEGRCPGVSCGLVRYAYHRRLQTLLQSRQPQHRQHSVPRPRAPLLRPNREDHRRRRQGGVCGQRCARGKAQDRRHVQGRLQVRRHGAGRQEGRPRRGAPPAHGGLRGMGAGPASPSLAEAGAAPCAAVRCGVLALRHERARRRGTWSSRTTSPSRPSESSS